MKTKITVVNKEWDIVVYSDSVMARKFKKCHGISILEDRKIFIRKSSFTEETIIHELVHAYQYELSYYELQLDEDQQEEWYAELFAKYGRIMLNLSDQLLKTIK
jgi:hypothetical protein